MKKICVPVDFSDASIKALDYALSLAEKLDARVDVVHVYHLSLAEAGRIPPELVEDRLAELKEEMKQKLEALRDRQGGDRIAHTEPIYGIFVDAEISDYVRDAGCDLIVMGIRGQHSMLEKLVGNTTTMTMMHAPVPVLGVPEKAEWGEIRKIAYATEFRPTAKLAVKQLKEFADAVGAQLYLVHVCKDRTQNPAHLVKEWEAEVGRTFDGISIVYQDDVIKGLDEYVQTHQIDILSLFIPARRLWERLFHSSVSQRMVYHSTIPLLIFHE